MAEVWERERLPSRGSCACSWPLQLATGHTRSGDLRALAVPCAGQALVSLFTGPRGSSEGLPGPLA